MIKITILIKWLPICVATVGVFLYSISTENFASNLLSFLIGDSYSLGGLYLSIIWLASLAWVIIKGQQIEAAEGESPSSLHKISGLRQHHLLHVSAIPYNEQSKQVIARFKPVPANGQEKGTNKELVIKQDPPKSTSITGNFPNDGKKKEQPKEVIKPVEAEKKDDKKTATASKYDEVINQSSDSIEKGPLAKVNTGIKGVSILDEGKLNKLKGNVKYFGSNRKELQEN